MIKMVKVLESNPNESVYEFSVEKNEIPVDLKIATLKNTIENIIGACEIKMKITPRTGTLNFRIIKIAL